MKDNLRPLQNIFTSFTVRITTHPTKTLQPTHKNRIMVHQGYSNRLCSPHVDDILLKMEFEYHLPQASRIIEQFFVKVFTYRPNHAGSLMGH